MVNDRGRDPDDCHRRGDVEPSMTTFNPGRPTLEPARRAVPGGRPRRVRVRPGRLDDDRCVPVRRGVAARQRGVRAGLFGGALGMRRTFILHANGSKLPSDLLGPDRGPLRPRHPPGRGSRHQPQAPQGHPGRGPPGTGRGVLVAARADRAQPAGALAVGPRTPRSSSGAPARSRWKPPTVPVLDGGSEQERARLIAQRPREWQSAASPL
jgi:hypothetical protein